MQPGAAPEPKALLRPDAVPVAPPDLLQQTQQGCRRSARQLYREIGPDLFRFCRWMGLDEALCNDVVHDIFEAALCGSLPYDVRRGSAVGFLFGVARNRVLQHLRRSRRFVGLDGSAEDDEARDEAMDSAELAFSRRQDIAQVRQALMAVSVAHREVIVLCDFRDFSYEAASEILALPPGTLRSRLSRARAAVRKALLSQGVTA